MRRRPVLTAAGLLGVMAGLLLGAGPGATATPAPTRAVRPPSFAQHWGLQQVPKRFAPAAAGRLRPVDPYLALVADPTKVNWAWWESRSRRAGQLRAGKLAGRKIESVSGTAVEPVLIDEL